MGCHRCLWSFETSETALSSGFGARRGAYGEFRWRGGACAGHLEELAETYPLSQMACRLFCRKGLLERTRRLVGKQLEARQLHDRGNGLGLQCGRSLRDVHLLQDGFQDDSIRLWRNINKSGV